MKIVTYPHPALRYKSKPIARVDSQLRDIVRQMFDLMYLHKGVGLAANQVDLPIRLFVANLAADPNEGEERVFINPVISRPKGNEEHEEGCLSFPGLYCTVTRPGSVLVNSYDLSGREFEGEVDGFLGRVIQHELDHLDGVLFIDRLSTTARMVAAEAIEEFELDYEGRARRGEVPDTDTIEARLKQWEHRYC